MLRDNKKNKTNKKNNKNKKNKKNKKNNQKKNNSKLTQETFEQRVLADKRPQTNSLAENWPFLVSLQQTSPLPKEGTKQHKEKQKKERVR